MNVLYYYLIGFIIVWIVALLLKNKPYIDIDGIMIMLKTDKLRNIINKIANISPNFWKRFLNLLMPLGVILIVVMVWSVIYSLQIMFNQPTVSLILPGVDIPGSPIYIPFATGLIALATVLIIHEGGHGVVAAAEKIDIDSVGLILLGIIPGAFVEPNEKQLSEANSISKIRVFFAGPMANVILCIIALVISMGIGGFIASEHIYTTDGMEISSVVSGSPAEGVLADGMVIKSINNKTTSTTPEYMNALNGLHIGDRINIVTDKGEYNLTLSSSPSNSSKAYIGIRTKGHEIVTQQAKAKYGEVIPAVLPTLSEIFSLIYILNFAVGTFNLLPMKPLDGGLILEEVLNMRVTPQRHKEFNDTLNKYTRIFPMAVRCWISRRFNSLLNVLARYNLSEERAGTIMRMITTFFIVILIILIGYGTIPGILKML